MSAVTGELADQLDGLAVYRRPGPAGAPRVVLVHGSLDRAATFLRAARLLGDLDVTLYDRRGYARSIGTEPMPSLDAQVDDLLTVLDGRPAAVVGHSYGGIVTLTAAQRHPDLITSVGAFEAPMPWAAEAGSTAAGIGPSLMDAADEHGAPAAAEQFMRRVVGDERWEQLPERTQDQRRAEGAALLADVRSVHGVGAPYDPAGITQPVVAGHGSASPSRHVRAAQALATAAPDAELMVVEGGRHDTHNTHPEEFAQFVRRVVERVPRPA